MKVCYLRGINLELLHALMLNWRVTFHLMLLIVYDISQSYFFLHVVWYLSLYAFLNKNFRQFYTLQSVKIFVLFLGHFSSALSFTSVRCYASKGGILTGGLSRLPGQGN